ncbi:MAG: prolyl oligopeptidase family serine peptidase [Planctomycetes bacterium]|nr:prolyl oligopeptidase family serine peptidase [Planctomycetota bacterium]
MHFPAFVRVACLLFAPVSAALAGAAAAGGEERQEDEKLSYPQTKTVDHVDDYHGEKIADPYRWLEDPDSDDTRAWVGAQNKVTFGYLEKLPQREPIRKRLTELWNYERYGLPRRRQERYFFTRNDGLQNQSVLYVSEGLEGETRALIDPNTLSEDGTVALAGWRASEDGNLLAYGLAHAGSDWREWKVLDVETGEPLEDHLKWIKFSGVSWLPDGSGFYYSRYDEPEEGETFTGANYYQKLFFHELGEPQSQDQLIYERPDEKEWGFDGEVTEDGRFLIISVWRGTERKNQIFYKDLMVKDAPVVELITGFDSEYGFLGNDGGVFYFVTDLDAPLRRVIAVDIEHPARLNWSELIPQADSVLEGAGMVGDYFVAAYLKDARSDVRIFDLQGKHVRDVGLPAIGSAGGFGGRRDSNETFYYFTNYTTPTTIYRYNVATGESSVFREPTVDFNPDDFETRQVFYTSKDGARVPMFLTSRKGLKLDGNNPTILYGYGGFNISQSPGFSVSNVVWLENGGVYAVAGLRGGGEYGRDWHEAGMKDRKQNVFEDFIAAAAWLIDNKITSSDHLAIRGGSNGGLLVGAVMTQRPDLIACALPAVGVMDMLRFHKFTIGWAWVSEFGSSDDLEEFKTLRAYSPLHNLKPGVSYPATLVTTADHDDRVVPAHSFKFAAALQAAHAGEAPVLIRIETRAGHGAGKPTAKIIEEAADILAFALENTR